MKDFLKSEAFRRGVRTFVQAAAGYIVIHAMDVDFSADAVMGLLAASIAAGIAGIMNIDGDKNGGGEDNERN